MKTKILGILLVFMLPAVFSQPAPPMNIYGNVTEEGDPAIDNRVEFRYDGEVLDSYSTDLNGFYDIYIPYDESYANGNISAYIKDQQIFNVDYIEGESLRRDVQGEFRAPYVTDVSTDEFNESVLVEWETDEESITKLEYGKKNIRDEEIGEDGNYTLEHSLNVTNLDEATEYIFRIVTKDKDGNKRLSDTEEGFYTFETEGEKDSNGDDGSTGGQDSGEKAGGGSKNSTEDQENGGRLAPGAGATEFPVGVSEGDSLTIDRLLPQNSASVNVRSSESIDSIGFTAEEELDNLEISINDVEELPEGVRRPDNMYSVSQVEFSDSESVSDIVFNFSASNAWVASLSGSVNDVKLKRYADGRWQSLETEYDSLSDQSYLFTAESSGFSYFATVMDTEGSQIQLTNVNASPLKGDVPFNVTVEGVLENTAGTEASRDLEVYLGDVLSASERFELAPGEEKNFELDVRVTESGTKDLGVSGKVFQVEATESSLIAVLVLFLLLSAVTGSTVLFYMIYTGRLDLEEIKPQKENEGRIEVEDGKFQFKGDENSTKEGVKGHVTLTVGFEDGEPSLKERRVFRSVDQQLDFEWQHIIEGGLESVEEEMAQRIREFVKEVEEQNEDGFICSICMDEFDTEDALHIHQSIAHNIRCSVCGDSFETVRALHIHQGMKHEEISHDLYD